MREEWEEKIGRDGVYCMKNYDMFSVKKKYIIRHKILKCLYDKIEYDENHVPHLGKTKTSLNDIAFEINEEISDVILYHHGIPDNQAVCDTSSKTSHQMILQRDGIDCVIDEYWLSLGEKDLNERIYDKTKWFVPLFALSVTGATLMYNIINVQKIKNKVELLEKEIRQLKSINVSQTRK